MPDSLPGYSLLPWCRRGLASLIKGAPAVNYASLPVSVAVNSVPKPGHRQTPPVRTKLSRKYDGVPPPVIYFPRLTIGWTIASVHHG